MSRLFSRLDDKSQGRTENDPPLPHDVPEPPTEAPAQSAGSPLSGPPAVPSPLPAYAASSPAAPAPAIAPPPAAWPVRLWFFSLLSLIAVSLLILALPARHSLLSSQRLDRAPGARPQASAPPRPAPGSAPLAIAPASKPTPSIVIPPAPRPAEPTPRPTQPSEPAPRRTAPAASERNPASAACSEAMRAMNLCATPSP